MIGIPPLVQWISKRIMRAALDSTLENTMVMTSNAGGILQNIQRTQRRPAAPSWKSAKASSRADSPSRDISPMAVARNAWTSPRNHSSENLERVKGIEPSS